MGACRSNSPNAVTRLWDNYLTVLHKKGVRAPFDQWHVKRSEAFVRASSKRLVQQTPADVEVYLRRVGRESRLKSWQFRQIVDAIRTLFEVVGVPWMDQVDWQHWRDSAQTLPRDHPTAARDFDQHPRPLGDVDDTRSDKGALAEAGRKHAELVQAIRTAARRRGLAIRTEESYEHWVLRFLIFHEPADAAQLGPADVAAYLDFLALRRNVSASTQNIALNALVFLFRGVFGRENLDFGDFARAKRPRRLPTVLDVSEVSALMQRLDGSRRLMVGLMYGTGMRLMECCQLRVQDIDFAYNQVLVRNAKGGKDRVVPLPARAVEPLREHLERVKALHKEDLEKGLGEVYLPGALARKMPNAAKSWGWQYVFPSSKLSADPRTGAQRRHHVHENGLQKAVKPAAADAGPHCQDRCRLPLGGFV